MEKFVVFWYQWGDEPRGYVSVGFYDDSNKFVSMGRLPKVKSVGMQFHCPFS